MTPLQSGLPLAVGDHERLARFIPSSGWFAKTTGRVKHQAFLPAADHETSVARSTGLPEHRLWQLGEEYLRGKHFYGAAVVPAAIIRRNMLEAVPQEPPLFHANVLGWPVESDPELQKARRKAIAESIAEDAVLLLRQSVS